MLPISLVILGTLLVQISVVRAGVTGRGEHDNSPDSEDRAGVDGGEEQLGDVDTDVSNTQNRNIAAVVNVVLPKKSETCRRCICAITDDCPTSPDRTCLSAGSLCCCCASRSFSCQGQDGLLQPRPDFVESFSEIDTD